MILVDYNQVILASLFASIGNHHNIDLDENLIRHMFLNSLLSNRRKFRKDYGEIVICADSKNVWRKDIFPYYKANRKKSRDKSEIDWGALFDILNNIRDELYEFFPYKVLHVDRCEADDIIATLAQEFGTELNTGSEKILILSGDRDYIQLHRYSNVDQYDPIRKKWVRHNNPELYLKEHLLKGDAGDGVPNILSNDNCLAIGERQKAMTAKRMEKYMKGVEEMDEETKLRYFRNKRMIDMTEIPQEYKDEILEQYYSEQPNGREKLFNFFIQKKLKHLLTDIQDF